jgi:hypothetical protein
LIDNQIPSQSKDQNVFEIMKNVFQLAIWMTQQTCLQNLGLFYLLDSIFEARTIKECELLFELLEENTKPLSEV